MSASARPRPAMWWIRDLRRDVPYALRGLARAPGFAAVAIVTIALGIGANAAVFSAVDRVLLRPLPYDQPQHLVRVWEARVSDPAFRGSVSVPNLNDWRRDSKAFAALVGYTSQGMNLEGGTSPERVQVVAAEGNLFALLRARPSRGRVFDANDATAGREQVVVISEGFWRRALGARTDVIGSTVRLDKTPYTVIGIMPAGFRWPSTSTQTEVWRPFVPTAGDLESRGNHFLQVVGRLANGVTLEQASVELRAIAARLEKTYPDNQADRTVFLMTLKDAVAERLRPALLTLMVSVALVLLIACANVANLQLARAATRAREITLRLALGAARGRLVRQLLTESLIVAMLGFALAMVFALWGVGALAAGAGSVLPTTAPIRLDLRVFGILLAITLVCGVAVGLAPALLASSRRLHEVLVGGSTRTTTTPGQLRLRHLLVGAQIALSLTLLVGAGLLMRSFAVLQSTATGMQVESAISFHLSPVFANDSARQAMPTRFYQPVLDRVRALPGVTHAGMISLLPIAQWGWNGDYWIEGRPKPEPGRAPIVEFREVSPGYFGAAGVPVIQGRDLIASDRTDGSQPILVNRALADLHFPGVSAVGERIRRGDSAEWLFTIVGVVGNVRQAGLDRDPLPEMYLPFGSPRAGFPSMTMIVRSTLPTADVQRAVLGAVRSVDATVPVSDIRLLEDVVDASLAPRRVGLWLMASFALLAMVLAATGLFAVMSYLVNDRTREIGVRMALGATAPRILSLVISQGGAVVLGGTMVGVVLALWLSRLLANQLIGVSVRDPVVFGAAPALLLATALLAMIVPAQRAARTPPQVALRSD